MGFYDPRSTLLALCKFDAYVHTGVLAGIKAELNCGCMCVSRVGANEVVLIGWKGHS